MLKAKADKARKLTIKFLAKQAAKPIHPANIKVLLCDPPTGSRQKLELQAVERLLGGVEFLEQEFWVRRSVI